jgi:hypothetical protein
MQPIKRNNKISKLSYSNFYHSSLCINIGLKIIYSKVPTVNWKVKLTVIIRIYFFRIQLQVYLGKIFVPNYKFFYISNEAFNVIFPIILLIFITIFFFNFSIYLFYTINEGQFCKLIHNLSFHIILITFFLICVIWWKQFILYYGTKGVIIENLKWNHT